MKGTIVLLLFFSFLAACSKDDDSKVKPADKPVEEQIEFSHKGYTLKGVLSKPSSTKDFPVVVMVQGDGATDRYSNGYYKAIMDTLNRAGIACLSWDKQGVGASKGNWLNQSMTDRAEEVVSAVVFLKGRSDIDVDNIILWGGSQGCWVIPKTYQMVSGISKLIFQSAAINWQRQGNYDSYVELTYAGYSEDEIHQCLGYCDAINQVLEQNSYSDYVALHNQQPQFVQEAIGLMDEDRWGFAVKNFKADITEDLKKVDCNVLSLFGEDDEHVDAKESVEVFNNIFSEMGNKNYQNFLFKNANHSLFDLNKIETLGANNDELQKLINKGENFFVPGFIDEVIKFVKK